MKPELEVSLLTGGGDRPYAFGLSTSLLSDGVCLDFIGSDDLDIPELRASPNFKMFKLRGSVSRDAGLIAKARRITTFYLRLLHYAWTAKPEIFHILWNNRFEIFDRTALMLYYKILGKRVAFTAHNVNAAKRDLRDSSLNRLTLRIQYHLCDHIFVHTEKMKLELLTDFGVDERAVTVIPFGINNSVPQTTLTSSEARLRLGIGPNEKVILFFGRIKQYKGLEYLVAAFQKLAETSQCYRLLIVGDVERDTLPYLRKVQDSIAQHPSRDRVTQTIEFVPDEETEVYFKAADVLALPYTQVFQSGVLFLAYSFGLPVVATEIASFQDDVVTGKTGFLCARSDAADLADALQTYFNSNLFRSLEEFRKEIRDFAAARNSWAIVSDKTRTVYSQMLDGNTIPTGPARPTNSESRCIR